MKKSKIWWMTFIAIITWMAMPLSVNSQSKVLPSRETIEMVKMELSNFQQLLPIEGGLGMIISAVDYDDATNTIKYRYTFTISVDAKPSVTQINDAKNLMVIAAKAEPKQKYLLEQGITFRYDYYSLFDEYLYSIKITPEDMTEDTASTDYGSSQVDIPYFAGDWESTNPKFRLSLSLSQHGSEVEVIVCQIYRIYAWEPTVRIEDGKLILDDPDESFSFHAEFVLRDGKLVGQCRAKGSPNDPNFSGTLTLKPEVSMDGY